jgi:hypothetical protein
MPQIHNSLTCFLVVFSFLWMCFSQQAVGQKPGRKTAQAGQDFETRLDSFLQQKIFFSDNSVDTRQACL